GMFFWNRSGEITDANDELLRMIGHSREDLREKRLDWIAMTPGDQRDRDQRGLEEMRGRGAYGPYEKEYISKSGARVRVIVGGAALDERAETGVSFVVSAPDPREGEPSLPLLAQAEARQEKLQAQLLQVQKLESLGVLAGGIAHD